MTDSLKIWGTDYTGVKGFKAKDSSNNQYAYLRPQGTKSITENGNNIDVAEYATVDVSVSGGGSPTLQTKAKNYTPTESQQTEAVSADSGYDGLDTVNVTVGAISSSYVGSGITRRSSSDLTASGNAVSAPAGYYESSASKSVASGTEGTPTATKGTVSNHSVSVTPSVTNSAGYIAGGTKTGTAVTVTASELASGNKAISSNGTGIDVVGYSTVSVDVPTGTARDSSDLTVSGATVNVPAGLYSSAASASVASGTAGTPTATKGAVSNHSISVTPSVTNTTGYITGSTKTGTAVSVSASELVSGGETKSANGTYDVTNLASLVVAVPIVTYYTGSSAPSSSLGSNGDIYLQTS